MSREFSSSRMFATDHILEITVPPDFLIESPCTIICLWCLPFFVLECEKMIRTSWKQNLQELNECVLEVGEHDVVFGRGGYSYGHAGNRLFRRLVQYNQELYCASTEAKHRSCLASSIVSAIHLTGGRFLRKEEGASFWKPVSVKDAIMKTSQALRDAKVRTDKFPSGSSAKASARQNLGSYLTCPAKSKTMKAPNHLNPESIALFPSFEPMQLAPQVVEDDDGIDASEMEIIQSFANSIASHQEEPHDKTTLRLSFISWFSSESENSIRRSFTWLSSQHCERPTPRWSFNWNVSDLLPCQDISVSRDPQLDLSREREYQAPAEAQKIEPILMGRLSITSASLVEAASLQDDVHEDFDVEYEVNIGDDSTHNDDIWFANDHQPASYRRGTAPCNFGLAPNGILF